MLRVLREGSRCAHARKRRKFESLRWHQNKKPEEQSVTILRVAFIIAKGNFFRICATKVVWRFLVGEFWGCFSPGHCWRKAKAWK